MNSILPSIMQSIKPQYCELIAAGRKAIEVRKTRPKLQPPFKVYIYCTKDTPFLLLPTYSKGSLTESDIWKCGNGKVIGEYICDEIIEYTTEFYPGNDLFQGIWKTVYDEDIDDTIDFIETSNDFDNPNDCDICKKSCLTFDDIKSYVGYGDRKFYAYHISNLKIYDEPKELSAFKVIDRDFLKSCPYRLRVYNNPDYTNGALLLGSYICNKDYVDLDFCREQCGKALKQLTRPPQSWCYVEEV